MRFPLLFKEMQFPPRFRCAWCKKSKVCKPNSMAILSGGAMLMDRRARFGGPDNKLDGFLSLIWFGAETDEGGMGAYPYIDKRLDIANDVRGGQFDINFCSTKCLRAFLNHAVDRLEEKITGKVKNKKGDGCTSSLIQ